MRSVLLAVMMVVAVSGSAACESNDQSPNGSTSSTPVATASGTPSRPPTATFVMPNVRGMYWADAQPLMSYYGWNGALVKLSNAVDSGMPSNAIVTQTPPPGQEIPTDTDIQIQFAG